MIFHLFAVAACLFLSSIYCSSFSPTTVPSYDEFIYHVVSQAAQLGVPNPENIREFDNVLSGVTAAEAVGYNVGGLVQDCYPANHIYNLVALDKCWTIKITVTYSREWAMQGRNWGQMVAKVTTPKGSVTITRIPGLQ